METITAPPTNTPPALTPRWKAAVAGMIGAGSSLAAGELLAAFSSRVASPLLAVNTYVVDLAPSWLKDLGIRLFDTNDKAALAIGTVVIVALIGAYVGIKGLLDRGAAMVWFGAFGAIGLVSMLTQPLINPVLSAIIGVASPIVGYAVYVWLIQAAEARAALESPTDGLPESGGRRNFIALAAGTGAAAIVGGAVGRRIATAVPEMPTTPLPTPDVALPAPGPANLFEIDGLTPIIVPNDEFYRIDTALAIPRVDSATWTFKVSGMVDTPLELGLDDLRAMPQHERYVTIACVSNEVGGDLVGNAKWTGVRLVDVLERAGVHENATQIVGRSVDGWDAGFPTELAFDGRDPLIAIGMNDELLPPRHGFPARLIVPGLYGYVSATKWLGEIELTTWEDFDGYWIPRGWAKEGPIKTQSRIDVPRSLVRTEGPDIKVAGVAWAPNLGIGAVEVRVDGGPWIDTEVTSPLSDDAWVQWQVVLPLQPGIYEVQSRATDTTGTPQTADLRLPRPDGASGYHTITVAVT